MATEPKKQRATCRQVKEWEVYKGEKPTTKLYEKEGTLSTSKYPSVGEMLTLAGMVVLFGMALMMICLPVAYAWVWIKKLLA